MTSLVSCGSRSRFPNAFIGADVVDWIRQHVAGVQDRRDARKYASHMLKCLNEGKAVNSRMWLYITIPNAFIGADVVDWILQHVAGVQDRRDARQYASHMLKVRQLTSLYASCCK
ncbi:unnamed protein product [Plutella xylostella]|uniref:(diamondback moth) hypothetical protein n=1 Tax=Plutella xylostella TaxID=51655 RepID=A0A8S4G1Z2_PLUXY|nr:unnamed protein product [Plutella xylostella]